MEQQQGQRRIDRVLDPAWLDGLSERSSAQVRAMRDDCREEESRLSYARRVLQAQLDIVHAEVARRRGEASDDLLGSLPSILADLPSAAARDARALDLYDPAVEEGRRREDGLLTDPSLSRVGELDDAELDALVARLSKQEHEVSHRRKTVLGHLDRLQDELVGRYREGTADVDEVVVPPSASDDR